MINNHHSDSINTLVNMGLTSSVTEHKEYSNDKQLLCHYFMKNNMLHGSYKSYYYNTKLNIDTQYNNGHQHNYYKQYDTQGIIIRHNIYHKSKDRITHSAQCAVYLRDKLCEYYIETDTKYYHDRQDIYYVRKSIKYIMINLSIINPIRSVQRKFRSHLYSKILNTLNYIIKINDLSLLIVSYIQKN